MTYRDLYTSAVGMTGEEIGGDSIGDYEEAAPYLLATFCMDAAEIDRRYRLAHGLAAATLPSVARVEMDNKFPLSDALAPAATYYLAAMLVADENEKLSDRLFTLYTDSISAIVTTLPCEICPVEDRYRIYP